MPRDVFGSSIGKAVRKQSLDVLELLAEIKHESNLFMFMEDDFVACQNLFRALPYVVDKVEEIGAEKWLGLG